MGAIAWRRVVAAAAAAGVVTMVAACSDDTDDAAAAPTTTTTVSIEESAAVVEEIVDDITVTTDDDVEVTEVAWVPLRELPSRLAYADERRLAEVAGELIDKLQANGPGALPPLPRSAPRRRPQTHSHARSHRRDDSTPPQPRRRTNGCGQGP